MYSVNIINEGDSVFKINSKDYGFLVDTKGNGITPPDTLLAGLGSCIGVYIAKYLEGARISSRGFSVSVKADFCKDRPVRFSRIDVSIDLAGLQIDEQRRGAMIQFLKNCPVHNTLKSNPDIEIKIV